MIKYTHITHIMQQLPPSPASSPRVNGEVLQVGTTYNNLGVVSVDILGPSAGKIRRCVGPHTRPHWYEMCMRCV